jgi:hypothetical protein
MIIGSAAHLAGSEVTPSVITVPKSGDGFSQSLSDQHPVPYAAPASLGVQHGSLQKTSDPFAKSDPAFGQDAVNLRTVETGFSPPDDNSALVRSGSEFTSPEFARSSDIVSRSLEADAGSGGGGSKSKSRGDTGIAASPVRPVRGLETINGAKVEGDAQRTGLPEDKVKEEPASRAIQEFKQDKEADMWSKVAGQFQKFLGAILNVVTPFVSPDSKASQNASKQAAHDEHRRSAAAVEAAHSFSPPRI